MTTPITKEWLQQTIAEYEASRDEIPFGLETNSAMELEAFKIALAAMDAEPVGFIARHKETGKFGSYLHPKADWFKNDAYEVLSAYTTPPAPVVPDELLTAIEEVLRISDRAHDAWVRAKSAIAGCRAAMLQGDKS